MAFGETGRGLEGLLLGKLRFWMVMFLSGTMKGKTAMFNRNAVHSEGTLSLQGRGKQLRVMKELVTECRLVVAVFLPAFAGSVVSCCASVS